PRPDGAAAEPARAQRTRPRARAGRAHTRWRTRGLAVGLGYAARGRPGLRAAAWLLAGGPRRGGAARPERGHHRGRRLGPAGGALVLRRLPAAQAGGAAGDAQRRLRDAGRVRVAAAPARHAAPARRARSPAP